MVAPWSKKLPLQEKSSVWPLSADQCLMTGTSCSCALAAGSIAYLIQQRECLSLDRLSPSAIISTVMTTGIFISFLELRRIEDSRCKIIILDFGYIHVKLLFLISDIYVKFNNFLRIVNAKLLILILYINVIVGKL